MGNPGFFVFFFFVFGNTKLRTSKDSYSRQLGREGDERDGGREMPPRNLVELEVPRARAQQGRREWAEGVARGGVIKCMTTSLL